MSAFECVGSADGDVASGEAVEWRGRDMVTSMRFGNEGARVTAREAEGEAFPAVAGCAAHRVPAVETAAGSGAATADGAIEVAGGRVRASSAEGEAVNAPRVALRKGMTPLPTLPALVVSVAFFKALSVLCVLAKSGRTSGSGRHAASMSVCSHSGHPFGMGGRSPALALTQA